MDRTASLGGDPNIGVFCRVFDGFAVIPPHTPPEFKASLIAACNVDLVETTIQGSPIVGSLIAGNRRGMVVCSLAEARERTVLAEYGEVLWLEETMNAAGNVILANDSFAAVHPDMPAGVASAIGAFLGVEVHTLTLGGVKTVGMAAVTTNRGVVINPRSTAQEIARLQSITELPIGKGSVNMGSGLVGSGLVANDAGYLAGSETTGFELGRIEDIIGIME
jgi:translation initiation factor 6